MKINIEGKEIKTLIDTGSEISVISEHVLDELREVNKNTQKLTRYTVHLWKILAPLNKLFQYNI